MYSYCYSTQVKWHINTCKVLTMIYKVKDILGIQHILIFLKENKYMLGSFRVKKKKRMNMLKLLFYLNKSKWLIIRVAFLNNRLWIKDSKINNKNISNENHAFEHDVILQISPIFVLSILIALKFGIQPPKEMKRWHLFSNNVQCI